MNKQQGNIIKVSFHEPVNNKTDYYFGSLKAIFTEFTPEQVGCRLASLYDAGISTTSFKVTPKCIISKHAITRMANKKKN